MSLFAGPSGHTSAPILYAGINVGMSMWNVPVMIFWGQRRLSTNLIWYGNFQRHKAANGKAGSSKSSQYTYSAAVIVALGEGPIDGIRRGFPNGSTTDTATLAQFTMALFSGTASQAPWSWIATNYPAQARAYAFTAYLATPQVGLGESATYPDRAFECMRASSLSFSYVPTSPGWINPATHNQDGVSGPFAANPAVDCLMSDIVTDLLTSVQYGLGLASGDLDATSLAQYAAYQRALGLHFSPLLNSQEKATAIIDRWAELSHSWIYWSGTELVFVPLGDAAITANGATYTPINDIAVSLTPNNAFLATEDGMPVKVTRKDPADAFNRTVLNICDRAMGYIANPVEWKDDALVSQYGLRDNSTVQADEICDPAVGRIAVQLIGKQKAYLRNSYQWKTGFRTADGFLLTRLLPGSIVTLTEPHAGLNAVPVRITDIKGAGGKDGTLAFTAEDWPGTLGVFYPPLAVAAQNPSQFPGELATPPSVNTPAIVEPGATFTNGVPQLIVAASGAAQFGGCTVYLSLDGVAYSQIGTIIGPATQGLLTANLAAYGGANPDVTNTLSVDCTESLSIPPATATTAQADALQTLCLVSPQPTLSGGIEVLSNAGELLAFGTVVASGTYAANLTHLQRGAYGTGAGAHSTGDQFTLFDMSGQDGTTLIYNLPASYIGKTLYLKFSSFNLFDEEQQDLSVCTEYQYTPTGTGTTPAVPTAVGAIWTSTTEIQVRWRNPISTTFDHARVFRGTTNVFSAAADVSGPVYGAPGAFETFLQPGMTAGTTYYYWVRAETATDILSAPVGPVTPGSGPGSLDFRQPGNPFETL